MEAMWRGNKGDKGEKGDRGPSITHGARIAFLVLFLIMIGISGAALLAGIRAYDTLQNRQLTQCQFNQDLGNLASVKVTLNPATRKASKIGVAVIADSRSAFRGLGCPGRLAKPGPSFIHWTTIYHLPVS